MGIEAAWRMLDDASERVWRASEALSRAGIAHAVIGSHAVDHWVNQVSGTRAMFSTRIDLLIRRRDGKAARDALIVAMVWPVLLRFTGEWPEGWSCPLPGLSGVAADGGRRVMGVAGLVRMLLNAWRNLDMVHLRQLADEGLIDESWPSRYPAELAERLQRILDTPDG